MRGPFFSRTAEVTVTMTRMPFAVFPNIHRCLTSFDFCGASLNLTPNSSSSRSLKAWARCAYSSKRSPLSRTSAEAEAIRLVSVSWSSTVSKPNHLFVTTATNALPPMSLMGARDRSGAHAPSQTSPHLRLFGSGMSFAHAETTENARRTIPHCLKKRVDVFAIVPCPFCR